MDKLSFDARKLLAATMVSNMGNGMSTIAMGKVLYDHTGSVMSFGFVLILESLMSFLALIFAGSLVDRGKPQKVAVAADLLRGIIWLIATVFILQGQIRLTLMLTVFLIGLIAPFFKTALFKIGPRVAEGEALYQFNSLQSSCQQIGVLVGVGISGALIAWFGTGTLFAVDGISFLISGLLIAWARNVDVIGAPAAGDKPAPKSSIVQDWKQLYVAYRQQGRLALLTVLSSVDLLLVMFFNLLLVPLVTLRFQSPLWLSGVDGAFAAGAFITALNAVRIKRQYAHSTLVVGGFLLSALVFAGFSQVTSPWLACGLAFLLGCSSVTTMSVLKTSLQQQMPDQLQGKVQSVRLSALSLMSVTLVPVMNWCIGLSLASGYLFGAGLLVLVLGAGAWLFLIREPQLQPAVETV